MSEITCHFCHIDKDKETILFETDNFICIQAKPPIHEGHYLLIPKVHIVEESEIPHELQEEYLGAKNEAYQKIGNMFSFKPLSFINPPQQQSVPHFHINYVPGIFGISGVKNALISSLNK